MSFDFKKYLQENKVGPYSKDLTSESGEVFEAPKPPAEDDIYQKSEPQDSEEDYGEGYEFGDNPWVSQLESAREGLRAGPWTAYMEHPGVIVWYHDDLQVDGNYLAVYATPHWDGADGTPIQVSVGMEQIEPNEIGMEELQDGDFPTFMDYAEAVYPYLEKVEQLALQGTWDDLVEAPTPPAEDDIYQKDDKEKIELGKNYFDSSYDMADDDEEFGEDAWINRMDGLGGDEMARIAKELYDDGFELEDILQYIKIKLNNAG